ncbi:uncharacterized protein [Littorina saxatilis]|uniref:uncharacterized protein n=1 Tax=Littorina saxatilis TaxID=31220 RepID=UPI0038B665D1
MADSPEPMEVPEETMQVHEEPLVQYLAQMEVCSEQAECSAQKVEHPEIAVCKQRVKEWYPNLPKQAYFVPAVYMNRTQHKPEKVAGQEVYVLQPLTQDSDARDDVANNKVLRSIKELARGQVSGVPKQVMFVISQLEFRNYLNNLSQHAHPCAPPRVINKAPTRQKQQTKQNKFEGDFDTLIIHRQFGVLACEIKAVGDNFVEINMPESEQNKTIKDKVKKAVDQLKKSRDVLHYLVSGDKHQPRISTSLIMPNISRKQLRAVLDAPPPQKRKLKEKLCESLGIDRTMDPAQKCFTTDDVINPYTWWQQCMDLSGPDPAMTDELYLDLISRFGGPATTVTVPCYSVPCLAKAHCPDIRTLGEGVVETANRFAPADIVLHPTQLNVFREKSSKPLVFLCGPPGTGKTLILILRALDWIQNKCKPVHVVSIREGNMAASHMIAHQLKEMTSQTGNNPQVQLHIFDLPCEMNLCVKKLADSALDGELFVVVDESCDVYTSNSAKYFAQFCAKLQTRLKKGLHLWAASMYHEFTPEGFEEAVLTTPLRTPPLVTRHVMQHRALGPGKNVHGYKECAAPLPAEGPEHQDVLHQGPGHEHVKEPYDCEQCGLEVAQILNDHDVGKTGRAMGNHPQPPRCRDVLLLTWDSYLHDVTTGKNTRPASGLIRGLRQAGFPVTVLETGDKMAVGVVATMSGPDEIVAAGSRFVQGLERKIVVYVETAQPVYFDLDWARLCSMSRSTSKLIHVKPPDRPRSGQQQPAAVDS